MQVRWRRPSQVLARFDLTTRPGSVIHQQVYLSRSQTMQTQGHCHDHMPSPSSIAAWGLSGSRSYVEANGYHCLAQLKCAWAGSCRTTDK